MKNIIPFLTDLRSNNNRDWFQANKNRYDLARAEMEALVGHLLLKLAAFEPSLASQDAKKCLFRIYRDVRFSRDKTPYKTHFGAYMAPGGRKSPFAGYYLHLEPGNCLLAGGAHRPAPEQLRNIRWDIYYRLDEFRQIIEAPDFKQLFGEIHGRRLQRPPLGFPKDFEAMDLLKFKDFDVLHFFPDKRVTEPDFADFVVGVFEKIKPFNDFMNRAIAAE